MLTCTTLSHMEKARFENSPIGNLTSISGVDGRFRRPFEHFAYVPHPLDVEPQLSSKTWHAVTAANRSLARLDQASRQVPNPDLLRQPAFRREAQSTSALEGTFAPLEQVLGAEIDDPSQSKELREVMNYVEAANFAFNSLAERGLVSGSEIEATHGILVRGTEADTEEAGKVRSIQVAIGSTTGSIEDSRFVPMPPGIALKAAFNDLIDWIRKEKEADPLVAAAMAHYQFETMHPFNDGNGRLGRMLIVLQLMADGIIAEPLLTVSPWFEARRTQYQDHLAYVSETGDWDEWVHFFAQGVNASAVDVARRVNRLLAVEAVYVERLRGAGVTGLARDIVGILIGSPVLTASTVRDRFGRSSQASGAALQKLTSVGILSEPIGNYNKRFVAMDVMMTLMAAEGKVLAPEEALEYTPSA